MTATDPRERISQEAHDARVQEALDVAQGDPQVKHVEYNPANDWVMVEIKGQGGPDSQSPDDLALEPPNIVARFPENCGPHQDPLFEDISDETGGFEKTNTKTIQTGVHPDTDRPLYGEVLQHFRLYQILFDGAGKGSRVSQSKNVACDPENNPNIK